jgi:hypothetical protein
MPSIENKENYLNIAVEECPNLPSSEDEKKMKAVPKHIPKV